MERIFSCFAGVTLRALPGGLVQETKIMKTVFSVSLPEKMDADLQALAKATGRTKNDIVKESLGLFLWETRFRQIKKRLAKKGQRCQVITEAVVFSGYRD
jgi:predicted transcriptional regulator